MRESDISVVEEKLLWEATLDVGAHEGHLELVEGNLARVVGVKPVKHLLEQHSLLSLIKCLTERLDERFTHRLALVEVKPTVAIVIGFAESFFDEDSELLRHALHLLFLHLFILIDEVIEHELSFKVDSYELSRCCLHDELNSLHEASLDLNMHL